MRRSGADRLRHDVSFRRGKARREALRHVLHAQAKEGDNMMAYLALAERFSSARSQPAALAVPMAEAPREFTPREWLVVKLARSDSLSSLREESELMEFLRLVFGYPRARPLSDPKLESLRRLAVMSWHYGYNIDGGDLEAFLGAGYSLDQYEALLGHIGRERAASTRKARR
jgi:hypothetical protein